MFSGRFALDGMADPAGASGAATAHAKLENLLTRLIEVAGDESKDWPDVVIESDSAFRGHLPIGRVGQGKQAKVCSRDRLQMWKRVGRSRCCCCSCSGGVSNITRSSRRCGDISIAATATTVQHACSLQADDSQGSLRFGVQ